MIKRLSSYPFLRPISLILVLLTFFVPVLSSFAGCSGTNSNTFNKLLKLVPAQAKDAESPITLIDYASYREDNDISLTATGGQPITLDEYLDRILQDPVGTRLGGADITGLGRYAFTYNVNLEKYLGYNFTNIDAEIQAGDPPGNVVAAIGRFNPQKALTGLSHQDEWPSWVKDAYTTEEYYGITVHSWGDGFRMDLTAPLVPPHLDNLGRARPLALTDNYLFYAPSVSMIQLMIDSSQDKADSLADVPEYASIANGLSDMNAYIAMIGDESLANGDPEYLGVYTGPRLKKFTTFGTGLGRDKNGIYMALVLFHENPDDAASNISLLEQRLNSTSSIFTNKPWSEMITSTKINVEGNVLLAKLYAENVTLWAGWLYSNDTLLLHEQE